MIYLALCYFDIDILEQSLRFCAIWLAYLRKARHQLDEVWV